MNMQSLSSISRGRHAATASGVQCVIGKLDGVGAVAVAFQSGTAVVRFDSHLVTPFQLERVAPEKQEKQEKQGNGVESAT